MAVVAKLARYLAPSAVAAVLGAGIVGLVDALPNAYDVVAGAAAVGFVSVIAAPSLLIIALVVRGLWRSWAGPADARASTWWPSASPWVAYSFLATAIFCLSAFYLLHQLFLLTSARNVVAIAAAGLMSMVGLLLVALARPCASLLERLLRRVGRPVVMVVASALGSAILVWLTVVRGRIGTLHLGFTWALAVGLAVFVGGHVALSRAPARWLKIGGAFAGVALLVQLVAAGWVLAERPYTLLALWGDAPLAGTAIDNIIGVENFREQLDVAEFRPQEIAGAQHPSVVLITIDTVRADRTPLHGGPAKMPKLAAFARRGATFEWAFSAGNVTRRSLPALATGLLPGRVRGRVVGWALRMDPRHVLLAERFKAAGYQTAGFFCCVSHFGPERNLGLHRGFDEVVLEFDGSELVKSALAWLEQREQAGASRPAFVWVHLFDPHEWSKEFPRKKYGGDHRSRYDRALEAVDDDLAPLLTHLGVPSSEQKTIAVVSSDHGEGLGDHGERQHAGTLYNSEIHVPLVMVGAGIRRGRIPEPVSLVDLAPTLLELAGFTPPESPSMDGRSFAGLATGKRPSDVNRGRAFSRMVRDRSVDLSEWALVAGRYKLIVGAGPPKLYDYMSDRAEKNDLADKERKLLAELLAELGEWRRVDRSSPF